MKTKKQLKKLKKDLQIIFNYIGDELEDKKRIANLKAGKGMSSECADADEVVMLVNGLHERAEFAEDKLRAINEILQAGNGCDGDCENCVENSDNIGEGIKT